MLIALQKLFEMCLNEKEICLWSICEIKLENYKPSVIDIFSTSWYALMFSSCQWYSRKRRLESTGHISPTSEKTPSLNCEKHAQWQLVIDFTSCCDVHLCLADSARMCSIDADVIS